MTWPAFMNLAARKLRLATSVLCLLLRLAVVSSYCRSFARSCALLAPFAQIQQVPGLHDDLGLVIQCPV